MVIDGHAVDSVRFTHRTRLAEPHLRSGSAIVIRQDELFSSLRQRCRDLGVVVHEETRATSPIIERGFLRGAACDDARELLADIRSSQMGRTAHLVEPSVHTVAVTFHISSQ